MTCTHLRSMRAVFAFAATLISFVNSQEYSGRNNPDTNRALTGLDLGPLWLPKEYQITCCLSGYPVPENPHLVRNWTQEVIDFVPDEPVYDNGTPDESSADNCRVFRGSYYLSMGSFFQLRGTNGYNDGVLCKCSDVGRKQLLDKNCRRLLPCQHRGNRSFSMNLRCVCPEPYFGDYCEKFCDQGTRLKDPNGRDYCSCVPYYQGEECKDMVCLNGGTQVDQHCTCPPGFHGYNCEFDANRTSINSRYLKFDEQGNDLFSRDVSGTIFSLIMIIVLIVSMYLLMKHRMQVQNRFATLRRDEMSRTAQGITSRRFEIVTPESSRILPFHGSPVTDGGPPPYISNSRGFLRRQEILPPLPSYEDATKLPPLTRPTVVEPTTNLEESSSQTHIHPDSNEPVMAGGDAVIHVHPSTSRSNSLAQVPDVVVERQRIERSSSTRKSI